MARSKQDFQDILLTEFRGLYSRGTEDTVPEGYFIDSLNVDLDQNDAITTRAGSTQVLNKAGIVRYWTYKRLGETPRYLFLNSSGELYDSLYGAALLTNVNHIDFTAVSVYNRAYIVFHNRVTGISGSKLYVYQGGGPGSLRVALGAAPSSFTLGVADSASSGDIEEGIHLFAVAFETDSGFVTAPGPEIFTAYLAPGGKKADVTALPIGPSGTVARWVLATRSVDPTLYDGNQDGLEFFFAHRVGDNTSTSVAGLSFFDADLVDSADYLFDLASSMNSGLGVTNFGNRLVLWGIPGEEHVVRISDSLSPENFNTVSGFVICDPSDSIAGVKNCVEFRNNIYIIKTNRVYNAGDNGSDPDTWTLNVVDRAAGCEIHGIGLIQDAKGAATDRFFIADRSGILCFEGAVFKRPEMSYNIKGLWSRINKTVFNKVVLAVDPENQIIYAAVPLDDSTELDTVLVGNYSKSYSPIGFIIPQQVRWTIYQFAEDLTHFSVDVDSDNISKYFFSYKTSGNIYRDNPDTTDDDGVGFLNYFQTHLLWPAPGYESYFGMVSSRITGNGNLQLIIRALDESDDTQIDNFFVLNGVPGQEFWREIDFTHERATFVFNLLNKGEFMQVQYVMIKARPVWKRPNV